ncbi:MAG: hypothetical protein ABJA69_03000 [Acidobacteriaceae bacterium]
MPGKATAADADLLLKLYDLRREPELRKARNWMVVTFWPRSADEITKISANFGSQENNWWRQVSGYWSMAASLVEHGALNADLFLEPPSSGEMYLIFAKVKPFLPELRQKLSPTMFLTIENVINSTEKSRAHLQRTEANVANRLKAMAEAAK